MIKQLMYDFEDGTRIEFTKYTIVNGVIKNHKGEPMAYRKTKAGYNRCTVTYDNGKRRSILVGRAIASSIYGPPPTSLHTADHKDKNRGNDTDANIRWLCKPGQSLNQDRPETLKTAFIIIKDDIEKTANEWAIYLKNQINHLGHEYTKTMINQYAQKKQHGFSYKEYPNLPNEVWKDIIGSKNGREGYWKISNMNRITYITKHAKNVLSGDRIGLTSGYPTIYINGKHWYCHILAFMTFFPEEYANKKPYEMVLHEDDDPLDFRPHKLRLGTSSDNGVDAHNNGCYDGTKTAKMKCVSYINGIYEIMHNSQDDAAKYLRHIGYDNASCGGICNALNDKRISNSAYDRTWKKYEITI